LKHQQNSNSSLGSVISETKQVSRWKRGLRNCFWM